MINTKVIRCTNENIVSLCDDEYKVEELNHYINAAQVVTINELIKTKEEAIRVRPAFSLFVRKYEKKWNKKFKNFNLLEKDQVKKEFYVMYTKIKKVKI